MTEAGWHPDPHGRADRRYHDGTRWTEHVTDADGRETSIDPVDPDPPRPAATAPVIGPPPPRAGAGPAATVPPASTPPASDPPSATSPSATSPPADVTRTERLTPDDIAAAAAPSLAKPAPSRPSGADHTVVMTADEVAAAASLAASPPPVGATAGQHTEPISPEDVAAAAALARGGAVPEPDAPAERPKARVSLVGLGLALAGTALGVIVLLVLPWVSGSDTSYLDLRDLVDTTGPDIPVATSSFVLSGGLFAVGVGGVAALARAIGAAPLRILAACVAVLGVAGLAVLGVAAADVEAITGASDQGIGAEAGAPVTLPDGTPVTEPSTGAPVTVPESMAGAEGLSEDQIADATVSRAEDRLMQAAVVGAAVMVVAGALVVVGLALRRTMGHVLVAVGLLVVTGWAVASLVGQRDVGDTGIGAYLVIVSTVLLATGAAVPGRGRRDEPEPA